MKLVLLVSGKRCVGKDTFCNMLEKKLQDKSILVEKFAAADECKRLFAKEKNLDYERLRNDREYKEQHRVGLTEFFWTIDLHVFERLVANSIGKSAATVCIVTDFRFATQLGEVLILSNVCEIAVRINCNDENRSKRGWIFDEKKDNDVTETALDDFEFFEKLIDNNGTLADLEEKVDQLLKEFNF